MILRKINQLNLHKITSVRSKYTYCKIATINSIKPEQNVEIKGWIQNIRKMKQDIFVDINDGSCVTNLQTIYPKTGSPKMNVGDSIEAKGCLSISPEGRLELHAKIMNILGHCNIKDGYPFTPKQTHPPEYLREYIHMRSRVKPLSSLFRIRHYATKFFHDFLNEKGLINIHTPILTSNDCEGAGEVFLVKPDNENLLKQMNKSNIPIDESYFDKKTFLSVSGQLCLEAACHGLGSSYTFLPAFRAENSKGPHHLSEFYMLEVELAFIENLKQITDFLEDMLKTVTMKLFHICLDDLKNCSQYEDFNENFEWLNKKWPIKEFDEIANIIQENHDNFKTPIKLMEGFTKEQELFLVEHFKGPIFIINWPKLSKPFYMQEMIEDSSKVYAIDLLMPGVGEVAGGSLRENNYERLKGKCPSGLEWYLELRKFGSIPTGGFGLGFERYLQSITRIKNIRDVIPYPRWAHNCSM